MYQYRVTTGSFFHNGELLQVGAVFDAESDKLAEMFSVLALLPPPVPAQPAPPVPVRFKARHVVMRKWGVFCVETGRLILNRYVEKDRALLLAEKSNAGTLTAQDKEVNLRAWEALYGDKSNR